MPETNFSHSRGEKQWTIETDERGMISTLRKIKGKKPDVVEFVKDDGNYVVAIVDSRCVSLRIPTSRIMTEEEMERARRMGKNNMGRRKKREEENSGN